MGLALSISQQTSIVGDPGIELRGHKELLYIIQKGKMLAYFIAESCKTFFFK